MLAAVCCCQDDIYDSQSVSNNKTNQSTNGETDKTEIKVIDCTCPFVKKIHNIVYKHYNEGYQIVIIGKAEHPEVVGINGWCNNSAIILDDEENIPESLFVADKLCVVAQTTYSVDKFEKILKKIKINCVKTVAVFKTICYTTMERQAEAQTLSNAMQWSLLVAFQVLTLKNFTIYVKVIVKILT